MSDSVFKAKKESSEGRGSFELLSPYAEYRAALRMEEGKRKYGARNWEKGLPFSRCIQAVLRHVYQYMAGDRSEDHLAGARCTLDFMMHYECTGREELWDLPGEFCHFDVSRFVGYGNGVEENTPAEETPSEGQSGNWYQDFLGRFLGRESTGG